MLGLELLFVVMLGSRIVAAGVSPWPERYEFTYMEAQSLVYSSPIAY